MASTGLGKSYPLTHDSIDDVVTKESPGAYVLGYLNGDGAFVVEYAGRSDENVNSRLHDWVGKYKRFKFAYYDSPKAAFDKECRIWHDFGGEDGSLDNEKHPQRPENSSWQCPRCDVFKTEMGWY